MTIRASVRSALILATGLFMCFAGPSQAAGTNDETPNAKSSAKSETAGAAVTLHKSKKYAHRRSSEVALKSAGDKKADAADDGNHAPPIPASVANANAQLTSPDTPTGIAAQAMSTRANDILQTAPVSAQPAADAHVVAADQLNDVDRALHESPPPTATLAMTSAAPAAAAAANSTENSTWDQTSLIGKIFIGFGALLTMASAARMFMA